MAVLYHSCDLEPAVRHQFCPVDNWCHYKSNNPAAFEHQAHHLDEILFQELLPIFQNYTKTYILEKMLPGYTTNINESFNHVLWNIISKTKFHGKKRQEIATILALITFQLGNKAITEVMQRFELEVTENATEVFRQLDLNKDYSWAYKTRQMEALYKTRMNEALEQRANVDPGYGAGVFDQSDSITADISFPQVSKMNETLNTLFFTKKTRHLG